MRSVRMTGPVALVIVSLLTFASTASAATVSFAPGAPDIQKVTYTAAGGETNDLVVTYDADLHRYDFTDNPAVTVIDGDGASGCAVSGNTASCPDPQLADPNDVCDPFNSQGTCIDDFELEIRLDDIDDGATVSARDASTDVLTDGGTGDDGMIGGMGRNVMRGGRGSDEIVGGPNKDLLFAVRTTQLDNGDGPGDTLRSGPGPDRVTGGSGDDLLEGDSGEDDLKGGSGADAIESRDDAADTVSCGDGIDPVVVADALDTFPSGDCEEVDDGVIPEPIPEPPSPAPAGSGPVTPSSNSVVVIAGSAVRVSRRGVARVELNCSGTKPCAGSVVLATSRPVRTSRRKRIVRLGQAEFTIPASQRRRVRVHISRRGMRLLRRLRSVGTDVIVNDRDPAGRRRVHSRMVVLRAPGRG